MMLPNLRAFAIIAAAWLIGMTMYSLWSQPALNGADDGVLNAVATPVAVESVADGLASKHDKLPVRWAHQRWGAV